MAKIYSMAKCDLLWISDDPNGVTRHAFMIVEAMAKKFHGSLNQDAFDRQELDSVILSMAKDETALLILRSVFSDPLVWNRYGLSRKLQQYKALNCIAAFDPCLGIF